MKIILSLFLIVINYNFIFSQGIYPPNADSTGTTALHKDSSIFVNWAKTCQVNRGYQDFQNQSLGFATSGNSENAIGKSGINGTVSLGDNGEAVLTFEQSIINGPGFDFAVFENAFNHNFLELAFVEVSTNGIDYVRFPNYSNTQTNAQVGGFEELDPTYIHNLAGKYKVNYGTPFDLEELIDSSSIDLNNINYIKIIDVIGVINNTSSSLDYSLNEINDPYPTPYPTSGFDLDAIGVIHQFVDINKAIQKYTTLYPNPTKENLTIDFNKEGLKNITIINNLGQVVFEDETLLSKYTFSLKTLKGSYYVRTICKGNVNIEKVIFQ